MSAQLCVQAARASIHLLKYIPKGDSSCVWMIIYFPVTALVTLFANILQNPADTRSRSDVKLMNLVVTFLSMLSSDERNGSVKRMLSVCAEFERIARIVLDKADRENASRRKRKQGDSEQDAEIEATANEILTPAYRAAQSPPQQPSRSTPGPVPNADAFNPDFHGFNEVGYPSNQIRSVMTDSPQPFPFSPNFTHASLNDNNPLAQFGSPTIAAQMLQHQGGLPTSDTQGGDTTMAGMNGMTPLAMGGGGGTFEQNFNTVPQDLWRMPMTLEWDWADMTGFTGSGFTGYENGISMNGVLPDFSQGAQGTSGVNLNAMNVNGGRGR